MAETQQSATPNVHPLQRFITRLVRTIGMTLALILSVLLFFSVGLVFDSTSKVPEAIGIPARLVIAICSVFYICLLRLIQKPGITFAIGNENIKLDLYMVSYSLLIISGFVQSLLWVANPADDNHEPRATFILAIAAAFAYFRSQYQKTQRGSASK